jgi:hypothetical protein
LGLVFFEILKTPSTGQSVTPKSRLADALVRFLEFVPGYIALLFIFGDFTPYVGEPDRDVWVTQPSPGWGLMASASVAAPFAAFSALLFAVSGKLLPGFRLLRLFLVTAPGISAVVYLYGDFKTFLGGGPTSLVFYELPWGAERLVISAACGLVMAGVVAAGAWVYGAALAESSSARADR